MRPLLLLTCIYASVITHIAYENNGLCGSNPTALPSWDGDPNFGEWGDQLLYTIKVPVLPAHGTLYRCSLACTIKGEVINTSTSWTVRDIIYQSLFMYESEADFSGTDSFVVYVSRRDFTPSWGSNIVVKTIRHSVSVFQMPSLPVINTTTLEVSDPDGPDVRQNYYIQLDDCNAVLGSGFQGSCDGSSCTFHATATTFSAQLAKIRCANSDLKRVRGYLTFLDKPAFSGFCVQYVQNAAYQSTYLNIPTGLEVPSLQQFTRPGYSGTSRFALSQEEEDIGYIKVGEDDVVTYEFFDKTSFNALTEQGCRAKNYTVTGVAFNQTNDEYLAQSIKWSVCVLEVERLPVVLNATIRNNWAGQATPFVIEVVDFNDNTFGRDDVQYSRFAFRRDPFFRPPYFEDYAGVVFGNTSFGSSEIRTSDCVTLVTPNVVYQAFDFCYVVTGSESPPEGVYVTAVDAASGTSSVPAFIEFAPSVQLFVCDASSGPFIGNECTSVGMESNSKFGDAFIPIQFQVLAFPEDETFEIVFIVETFPSHGTLFSCGNDACTIPGTTPITPGRRVKRLRDQPVMWYKGNPDYFNYAVYHMVGESNALADYNSFSDRKGVPFGGCSNATNGCPDSFSFRYEHPYIDGQGGTGRYDIYVRNRGSNFEFGYRSTFSGYVNRYDSNIPVRIGWTGDTLTHSPYYNDPDGDTWDVELLVVTINAYVGRIDKLGALSLIPIVTECKEDDGVVQFCGGAFVLRGLPSDMKAYVEQDMWFYNWPSYNNASTTQPVYFTLSKRYAIETYSAENTIITALKDYLESYESDLNSCLQAKSSSSTPVSYASYVEPLRPMVLDATRVYVPGYFGSLSGSIPRYDPEGIQVTPATDCTIKAGALVRVISFIRSTYSSIKGDYFEALMYDTYGPTSREPIVSRRTYGNSSINFHTVTSETLEYSFRWKGPRFQAYPIILYIPPPAQSVDFWTRLGQFFIGNALTDPTPENIALAVLNVFLLFVPIPVAPLMNVLATPLRMIRGIGPLLSTSRLGSAMTNTILSNIRLGTIPFKTGSYKALGFLQDKLFDIVIRAGVQLTRLAFRIALLPLRIAKATFKTAISITASAVRTTKWAVLTGVTRLKAFRASRTGRIAPNVPAKPIRPTSWYNPASFPKVFKQAIPNVNLGGLVGKAFRTTIKTVGKRLPSIKGKILGRGFGRGFRVLRRNLAKIRRAALRRIRRVFAKIKDAVRKWKKKRKDRKKKQKKRNRKKEQQRRKAMRRNKNKKVRSKRKWRSRRRIRKFLKAASKLLPSFLLLSILDGLIQLFIFLLFLPMYITYFVVEVLFEEPEKSDAESSDDESVADDEEKPLVPKRKKSFLNS